jgi:glycosyltransferase involved in cell wall biosynthesis
MRDDATVDGDSVRVMQLVQSLARGGAERLTLELSLALRDAGHENLVVTLIDERGHGEPDYAAVAVRSLIALESFRWPWYLPRATRRLRAVVREWSPDLLLIHTQNAAVVAALAGTLPPAIQVIHSRWEAMCGTPFQVWRRRNLARWTFRRLGSRGVAVAPPLVGNSAGFLGCPSARVRCVPNGIRLEKFPFVPRKPSSRPHVGTVGSLTAFKRPDQVLRAFALLRDRLPGARLSIVGEGPLRPELERMRGELGLRNDVEFPGVCTDIPDRLSSWDLYWQLSRIEGGSPPLAVAEAMATGVPVVVSDVPGLREGVIDGETGVVVPSDDIRGVADRSAELLASPCRYGHIAAGARRFVEQRCDFQRTVTGYVRAAEDAIAGRW